MRGRLTEPARVVLCAGARPAGVGEPLWQISSLYALVRTRRVWIAAEHPAYLMLLAILPLLAVWSYRSLAGVGAIRLGMALGLRCAVVLLFVLALAGSARRASGR